MRKNLVKKIKMGIEKKFCNWSILIVVTMIVFGVLWEVLINPLRPTGSLLWLKIIPLVLTLPGLFKAKILTFQCLSLLVWLYICEALVRIYSDEWIEIVMSSLWLMLSLFLFFLIWRAMKILKNNNPNGES